VGREILGSQLLGNKGRYVRARGGALRGVWMIGFATFLTKEIFCSMIWKISLAAQNIFGTTTTSLTK
jgi:hypothetical protein